MNDLIKAYLKAYVWPLPKFKREVVVMVDGVHSHGGLTDRFRHILSIYSCCKQKKIPFYIYYVYPCDLSLILDPNQYDWRIGSSELTYTRYDSKEICLWVDDPDESLQTKKKINQQHVSMLDKEIGSGKRVQYHIYGNSYFAEGHYRELFVELFKPSQYLQERIDGVREQLPDSYEAVTLRFQQLLGDFTEGSFTVLPESERENLIQCCIKKIDSLYSSCYFSTSKLLVTSDSPTFLERVRELPYVRTIPGKMEHMDFTKNRDLEMNAKAFVDLFLLSQAQRLTLIQAGGMYKSGFPKFAAELGGKLYNELLYH